MKTAGEFEADVCEVARHFEQNYMGRGPESIYTHLLGLWCTNSKKTLSCGRIEGAQHHPAAPGSQLLVE